MANGTFIPLDKPRRREKPPKFLRRQKPRSAKSDREREQDRAWKIEKARAYVACRGKCTARVAADCNGEAQHPHHVRKRSLGGKENPRARWVCYRCHDFIEREPKLAAALGLVDSRKSA